MRWWDGTAYELAGIYWVASILSKSCGFLLYLGAATILFLWALGEASVISILHHHCACVLLRVISLSCAGFVGALFFAIGLVNWLQQQAVVC